jgi:hypothetical protein
MLSIYVGVSGSSIKPLQRDEQKLVMDLQLKCKLSSISWLLILLSLILLAFAALLIMIPAQPKLASLLHFDSRNPPRAPSASDGSTLSARSSPATHTVMLSNRSKSRAGLRQDRDPACRRSSESGRRSIGDSSFWARLSGAARIANSATYSQPLLSDQKNPRAGMEGVGKTGICPFYFRYIYEDLAPWAASNRSRSIQQHTDDADASAGAMAQGHYGVSKEMLEYGARSTIVPSFRVIIKAGKLYVDAYRSCFQTRALFTIWGLLQLLDFYPGLVQDVDMLFACGDTPQVPKPNPGDMYSRTWKLPPIFSYCSTAGHLDIPFPDWSFWGWSVCRYVY